jgi:urease accessory protein
MSAAAAVLLLLADGRFPGGSHAHSGGLEAAVAAGRVTNETELASFLAGRLSTQGRTDAAIAAAATITASPTRRGTDRLLALDQEAAARCPSAAMRAASRAQGRGLARAARAAFDGGVVDQLHQQLPDGAMWPVALGAACSDAHLGSERAALLAAYAVTTTPAWAATRLLGLDPLSVAALLAMLAGDIDRAAADGAAAATAWRDGDDLALPAAAAIQLELDAEVHARWEVRLFAS